MVFTLFLMKDDVMLPGFFSVYSSLINMFSVKTLTLYRVSMESSSMSSHHRRVEILLLRCVASLTEDSSAGGFLFVQFGFK